jgi:hypothetical protein
MRVRRSLRSARIGAALAIASGALVACNLITGLDADYSSTAHDGAATPVAEGGGGDALTPDGEVGDGAMLPDTNVTPETDAGLSVWCQSKRNGVAIDDFFCTDFEDAVLDGGDTAPSGWTSINNDRDAGVLSFVDIDASRALDVKGTATMSAGVHTRLLKIMNATTGKDASQYAHYELQYDFRVFDATVSYAALGVLVFWPYSVQAKEHGIAVFGGSPATLTQQGGPTALAKTMLNDGAWHHATITLDRRPDLGFARTILIDAKSVDGDTAEHTLDAGDPTDVSIGIFNGGGGVGTAHVQFDNVVFFRK